LHGYAEPHPEIRRAADGHFTFETMGGLARIKTLFDRTRADNPGGVVTLDNGDTFHGTHFAVKDQASALVPLVAALGFDAMTLHWEFAFGPERVAEIVRDLPYPVLAANIYREPSGDLFLPATTVIERRGVTIGIIGLACPIVDKTMPPAFSKGLRFEVGNHELAAHAKRLRPQVDLLVVLSHLGFPQDVQLAKEVAGLDVIVSGHTHNRMDHAIEVNGAVIFQSGCHGSFLGQLDVELAAGGIAGWRHRLIPVDTDVPADPELERAVSAACKRERSELAQVVGHTDVALHRYAMLSSPMDDLLLEAIAEAAGTTIAFSNGWRYGAPVAPGPVTLRDLWNMVPVNPPICVVDVTGAEIRQMLEDNLERTFAANPYEQMGGYIKRMRGIRMVFKAENANGRRIDRLYIDGRPADADAVYTVGFITTQGVPRKFGRNRRKLAVLAIDALRQRLARPFTSDASGTSVELV
jgi:2',3'-cyclic-nucleotide 2'-phosphodiesterase (5'-nucleotidase family)